MDEYEKYTSGHLLRDKYLRVADISEGSYGLVSVAKDTTNNDKLVAVKFIYPIEYKREKGNSSESARPTSFPARVKSLTKSNRLSKESILKTLYEEATKEISIHKILGSHPNVTALYDHFDSCLVLEYCSRGDLYEAIQNGQGPSLSQDIKDVFLQILSALEYCHSLNVFHRDLKPENILITEDWSVKICDWGLATTSKKITNRAEFDIGSERYMAPELFDSGITYYDASKLDLWSVGIILMTLVFHKNPFKVANYSDKRFVQFANNREALFDIFSTMSGDMFSVLRFSLNIDPSNRDLVSLRDELGLLKYFTVEEEYWASDYEEEDFEAEDDEYDNDELAQDTADEYSSDEVTQKASGDFTSKSLTSVTQEPTEIEVKPMIKVQDTAVVEGDKVHSKADGLKEYALLETDIPHNHRADALLSSCTKLKPIPIDEGHDIKFIRNTRKPFNVASYHTSSVSTNHANGKQNSYHFNNKHNFNREDFFTPKSVFNHYMDKYGELKQTTGNKYTHRNHYNGKNDGSKDWHKYKRKSRFWKRNERINQQKLGRGRNPNSQHNGDPSPVNAYNQRRRPRLHSSSKTGRKIPPNEGETSQSLQSTMVKAGSFALPPPNSSTGKQKKNQINLRSPQRIKSPDIGPLAEEIDSLSLNNDDDDEVFHLDNDFDSSNWVTQSTSSCKPHSNGHGSSQAAEPNFRQPNFDFPTYAIPGGGNYTLSKSSTNKGQNSTSSLLGLYKGSGNNTRRGSTFASTHRPLSMGNQDFPPSTAIGNSLGKYIPPFRRGSHCASGASHGSYTKSEASSGINGFYKKQTEDKGVLLNSLHNMMDDNIASSSAPSSKTNWFAYRKD